MAVNLEDVRVLGPFLYYPSRRHMPAALRAFIDFVGSSRAWPQTRPPR